MKPTVQVKVTAFAGRGKALPFSRRETGASMAKGIRWGFTVWSMFIAERRAFEVRVIFLVNWTE